MIVISKTFSLPHLHDFSAIAPLKDIVFIDIETTGLGAGSSRIYLIGAVYHQQMEWHERQWFADSLAAEYEMFTDFFTFLDNFQLIISFNGDRFDIPLIRKAASAYGIDTEKVFSHLKSFDLFRKLLPLKKLLHLDDSRLVTYEKFLGIERCDSKTGAELIGIYNQFLQTREAELYQMLLLHNEEDLKALPQLVSLLSYVDIFRCSRTVAGYSFNRQESSLTIVVDCTARVPISFTYSTDSYSISVRANQMIIELTAYHGTLKYFFDNYKDYYYLPDEDRAVHKKIGQYVDSDHREQATAATCYTCKDGFFLPLVTADMFDIYKSDYRSKELYTEFVDDTEFISAYVSNLLSGVLAQ